MTCGTCRLPRLETSGPCQAVLQKEATGNELVYPFHMAGIPDFSSSALFPGRPHQVDPKFL